MRASRKTGYFSRSNVGRGTLPLAFGAYVIVGLLTGRRGRFGDPTLLRQRGTRRRLFLLQKSIPPKNVAGLLRCFRRHVRVHVELEPSVGTPPCVGVPEHGADGN